MRIGYNYVYKGDDAMENRRYILLLPCYRRKTGEIIKEGESFQPTPREVRELKGNLKIQEEEKKITSKSGRIFDPPPVMLHPEYNVDRRTWKVKGEHELLFSTEGRNPYQDVRLGGETIYLGQRDCEGRYKAIKKYARMSSSTKVLDLGAAQGYFDFRLYEDFRCGKFYLFDSDHKLPSLVEANGYPGFGVLRGYRSGEEIADLISDINPDIIICLSFIHNISDWKPVMDELVKQIDNGKQVFIESPADEETLCMNAGNLRGINKVLYSKMHLDLGYTLDREMDQKRPLKLYQNKFDLPGKPISGTGNASKHTKLWKSQLKRITGMDMTDGTLNLQLPCKLILPVDDEKCEWFPIQEGRFYLWKGSLNGREVYLVKPPKATWGAEYPEIMCSVNLRKELNLTNDSTVSLSVSEQEREIAPLNLAIVTSLYGDYWKFLSDWVNSICDMEEKPSEVVVVISGKEAFRRCDEMWYRDLYKKFKDSGIEWSYIKIVDHIGMGRARNVAVENASSEWVMYLDVDDVILPNAMEELKPHAEKSDLICTGLALDGVRKGGKPFLFHNASSEAVLSGRHCSSSHSVWKRNLYPKCKYIEINDYVDSSLWIQIAHKTKMISATENPVTVYRSRKDGHYFSLSKEEIGEAREQNVKLRNGDLVIEELILEETSEIIKVKGRDGQ